MRLPLVKTRNYATHPVLGEENKYPLARAWRTDVGKATVVFVRDGHSLALVLDRAELEDIADMMQEIVKDWR